MLLDVKVLLMTPVGATEIAERLTQLGKPTARGTVAAWLSRRKEWEAAGRPQRRAREEPVPAPRWRVNGGPAWDFERDILPWCRRTGRLPAEAEAEAADG